MSFRKLVYLCFTQEDLLGLPFMCVCMNCVCDSVSSAPSGQKGIGWASLCVGEDTVAPSSEKGDGSPCGRK